MKNECTRCGFCAHLDPDRSWCHAYKDNRSPFDRDFIADCQKKNVFVRYLPLLPQIQDADSYLQVDYSKLPKDADGIPLFVLTKRGTESAIPAYDGLTLTGDALMGVEKAFTYQGQRELIAEYGVLIAEKICSLYNLNLVVLPEERDSLGNTKNIEKISKIYGITY